MPRPRSVLLCLFLLALLAPASAASASRQVSAAASAKIQLKGVSGVKQLTLRARQVSCHATRVTLVLPNTAALRFTVGRSWRRLTRQVRLRGVKYRLTLRARAGRERCGRVWVSPISAKRLAGQAKDPDSETQPPKPAKIPLGTALSSFHLNDPGYYQAASRFSVVTPENEMKWEFIQPRRGQFTFERADQIMAYARDHGQSVHGHTLLFHNQNPAWLNNTDWSREELIAVMREHIHALVGRYRGQIPAWDVVNEAFRPDGSYTNSVWLRVIGPEYIPMAFRFAREADPQARLYYNDIGAEVINPQSDRTYHMLRQWKAQGVPIDGIGFQTHVAADAGAPNPDSARGNFARFAKLGLELAISEADVDTEVVAGSTQQKLEAQRKTFSDLAQICAQEPACVRFTVWGVDDGHAWIGAHKMPLLLDSNYQPKPAWDAVVARLAAAKR